MWERYKAYKFRNPTRIMTEIKEQFDFDSDWLNLDEIIVIEDDGE